MTAIDFTAEVEKRKEDLLTDLFSLLEINSERDDSKADAQHPFGPGPVKALEKFLEIADHLVVVILAINRVFLHIGKRVVHPTHIPLKIKA